MRSPDQTARVSRGPSLEPAFAEGHHIAPTAGVSLLYHSWNRGEAGEAEAALAPAPLTSHGDIPPIQVRQEEPLPTKLEADVLLERYFRFAAPTYRFLHRPTLETWASRLLDGERLAPAQTACTLLVFAQSLLYTKQGDRYVNGADPDLIRCHYYFEKAKSLLNHEPGPASVASVQARLAMCLYLLSTFRINECRFSFSLACTILTSIGLHRKTAAASKMDLVTFESRKRTFWCAYVLDDYLSVMLGRPRMLRDEDIDQPYPRNIDDQDLLSPESAEDLPLHGNLEAFIAHADLAKLMGRNNDRLYPLHSITEDELYDRTNEMLDAVSKWKDGLPDFLKPREKTLTGDRTFERQNTILKLAHAHLRILITRRCLLADLGRLGRRTPAILDDRALKPIQECANAVNTVLTVMQDLMQKGNFYQAFWFTPYTSLVAISTLYVYIIQGSRANIPPLAVPDANSMFEKATFCQDRLAALAPEGSQANRHYQLLSRLKQRAEKDALRSKWIQISGRDSAAAIAPSAHGEQRMAFDDSVDTTHSSTVVGSGAHEQHQQAYRTTDTRFGGDFNARPHTTISQDDADLVANGQFTPSEDDVMFQNLLGWESLDTVGFPAGGDIFDLDFPSS